MTDRFRTTRGNGASTSFLRLYNSYRYVVNTLLMMSLYSSPAYRADPL